MRQKALLGIVAIALLIAVTFFLKRPGTQAPAPQQPEHVSEQFDKESYELGYQAGYETASKEHDAAYQQGYEAAKEEIGSGLLTRTGLLGLLFGFAAGLGSVLYIRRKEFSFHFKKWKKRIELRRAFRTIPQGLTPEIDELAHQIAHAYIEMLAQFRVNQNYLLAQYTKQWRPQLTLIMKKALNVLELIHELEHVRANIDEKELARKIRSMKRTIQSPNSGDDARNAAVRSLQRARQTQQELRNAEHNLERCTHSLQEIGAMFESMRLKVSNLKLNTQESGILDELSSNLEVEIQVLEDALQDVKI
ncbi:hypothetical protein CSB45_00125 [candidate division KSB3 bacterium]|uniref:Uncharacterized protein n=1 Tax=candidate division KSB3 bacterium TaxID=2044937 RepID=A0A2G6EGE8_9BACT|nr:MAG: hypothetical protein CSB45_00125 [candidate division KSB3 bacterium]PIE31125.1 MAG: hypothetical protein CSA57_00210 [candidate division KSB3 bacterium]